MKSINETKKVLLVFADSSIKRGLADAAELQGILQTASDMAGTRLEFYVTYARSLSFFVSNAASTVYDHHNKMDIKDFDFVYFRRASTVLQQMLACALYLEEHHVPYFDSEIGNTMSRNKLSQMFLLRQQNIPIPPTLYCRNRKRLIRLLTKNYKNYFTWPIVAKATGSSRGNFNYLVETPEELLQLVRSVRRHFVVQSYIPNDGDYRALIVNSRLRGLIQRVGVAGSHLNNTSKDGSATWLPVETLSPELRLIAVRAAQACKREIAGVDIVLDKRTQKPYVLEVNRGPQIEHASYPAEKATLLAAGIDDAIHDYEAPGMIKGTNVLGRREHVALVEFPALGTFTAKVDTGAYSNSLHCEYLAETTRDDGTKTLSFSPFVDRREVVTTDQYFVKKVTASNGVSEMRYTVQLHLKIGNQELESQVTLTNRGTMLYPMLIGRKFLKQYGYKVDVSKRL